MKIAIVVPSIRENSIMKFIEKWKIKDVDDYKLFVIEDNEFKTFKLPKYVNHYSHAEIDAEFPQPHIIPRKISGVRNFGFWKAWKDKYDYILTLDDDCYPHSSAKTIKVLINQHLKYINKITPNNGWFYTINNEYSRGMNYNDIKDVSVIKLSVGGWSKVPDLDGQKQLYYENNKLKFPQGKMHPEIVPKNVMYTLCGMHVFFPMDILNVMYWWPTLSKYYRYDDIWMGFVLKRYFDMMNYAMVNSAAVVTHSRASNAQRNFELESMNDGYLTNDAFSECIQNSYVYNFENYIELLMYITQCDRIHNNKYFETVSNNALTWYNIFK